MNHDGKLTLATGRTARTKVWANETWTWAKLVQKITEGHRTNETYKDYMAATKEEQLQIKDVGGFVGGRLVGGKRSPSSVAARQLITLDVDFANPDFWQDFTMLYGNAAVLHTTHKHSAASPRYRLLMPIDREVTSEEYCAIARSVAGSMGIERFDNTTFETNRLMFWPSTAKDGEYKTEFQDGVWLCADEVLASYSDWRDTSLWPMADRRDSQMREAAAKQQDPETKNGIVGAFCRTYSIGEAIERFLPNIYTETAHKDRYTFVGGTTAAGLVVYDDLFAFSHHGTDPTGGKLCNAFDLVRIHLFGHLDTAEASGVRAKSFQAMERMALEDEGVKATVSTELVASANYDFAEGLQADEVVDTDWLKEMEIDNKGKFLASAKNLSLILANDSNVKGAFKENVFSFKKYVCRSMPWRKVFKPEPIKNVDMSGIRSYIEQVYGIANKQKTDDALALEFEKRAFHPVRDYLNSLEWDGNKRVETLLHDYFGVPLNPYTREAIRTTLVGAVARVFEPGIKFDLMLTLVGKQGTYKSTFIRMLGREWYSDSFTTVTGNAAFEQLKGAWIIEVAELAGLRKNDLEAQKHYITKQSDTYRPAYSEVIETYPRQCVFIGSTNVRSFLQDSTGNRRFMPIDIDQTGATKSVFSDLPAEVDQIWAEAVTLYRSGTATYLSKEASMMANGYQKSHTETDERAGIIELYLDKPLPTNWPTLGVMERQLYLSAETEAPEDAAPRDIVCVAEVWCECLGKNREDMTRYNTRDINDIMRGLGGWVEAQSTKDFPIYGRQKFYKRA